MGGLWRRGIGALLIAAIATAATAPFSDVSDDDWFAEAVAWLADEGITTGISEGCFDPDGVLTRGEAAVFLHRLAGEPTPTDPLPFIDVSADWQLDAVRWLAEEGITTGVAPGWFDPGGPVTRGQFATLLHRFDGLPAAPPHAFADVTATWQQAAVSWLSAEAITTGTSEGRFSPDAFVTRAQLATFLHRYRGLPPAPEPTDPVPCRFPLRIHAVGDVNFDPGYGPNPQRSFGDAWTSFERLFLFDDLTLINLECTASALGTAVPKNFNFRCPTDALGPTHESGIDIANLANNHAGDFGLTAMLDGNTNVAASGIQPVGVGIDLEDAVAPVIVERHGWTIAVLGFNTLQFNPEWFAGPSRAGMAPGDIDTMVAAVEAADDLADLVFVTIHWGIEGTFAPAAADEARAEALIGAGADAIFGHHPHRLQPLTFIDDRPVFWSLGNFVWQSAESSRSTAVAWVDVRTDGTFVAGFFPVDIASKGVPVLE